MSRTRSHYLSLEMFQFSMMKICHLLKFMSGICACRKVCGAEEEGPLSEDDAEASESEACSDDEDRMHIINILNIILTRGDYLTLSHMIEALPLSDDHVLFCRRLKMEAWPTWKSQNVFLVEKLGERL